MRAYMHTGTQTQYHMFTKVTEIRRTRLSKPATNLLTPQNTQRLKYLNITGVSLMQ